MMMASRLSFNTQLSSIMESMAKSAVIEVCKLVEQDSSEILQEVTRLMVANSALVDKVNNLECELTVVRRSDHHHHPPPPLKLSRSCRSVAVQTRGEKEAGHVTGAPTIEGIFGQQWCVDLWKERGPHSLERVTDSSCKISDEITVTEIKVEEDAEEAASSCPQETVSTEAEHKESAAQEPEHVSVDYSIDDSTCSLSFHQEEEAAEDVYSSHIIPVEEAEDGDAQFVQENLQEAWMNSVGEPSQNKPQSLPIYTDSYTIQDIVVHDDLNTLDAQDRNGDKFTCDVCSRTFFHKGTLTQHMKSHKSNFCSICKQHLPQRSKVKSHKCVPPLASKRVAKSCELCGKTFANPSALRIHYVVHTGEKPHRCIFCGKGFTQKGNLKCHLRIHTGERPFLCVKCGRSFTQKVNLNHHLMAHRNQEAVRAPRVDVTQNDV